VVERLHLVLQRREILRELGADNVGPCRQRLSELDVGRPELIERARQSLDPPRTLHVAALHQPAKPHAEAEHRRQRIRVGNRQRALTRQHPAGANETEVGRDAHAGSAPGGQLGAD
jgi:hypothetical protein